MDNYLQVRAIGKFPQIAITTAEYDAAYMARQCLSLALHIEQKWDVLLQNYIELEKDLISLALERVTLSSFGYATMGEALSTANRRYINLLTAARMYVDQVPRLVESFFKSGVGTAPPQAVHALLSEQYDSYFEYRFMEALRNYVQHNGAPVHSLTVGSSWTPEFNKQWSEASVQPYAMRETIEEDKTFKPAVLREMPEKVNLVVAVRRYMECLGQVQQRIRDSIAPHADAARGCIERLRCNYADVLGKKPTGLSAHRAAADGKTEHLPLLLDWDDVRVGLASRNSTLVNISKRTVTGRTHE